MFDMNIWEVRNSWRPWDKDLMVAKKTLDHVKWPLITLLKHEQSWMDMLTLFPCCPCLSPLTSTCCAHSFWNLGRQLLRKESGGGVFFLGGCLFSYTSSVSTNLYIHYYHTTDKITKSERDCDSEVLWNRVWGDNWKQALSYGSKSGMATEQCVAVTEGAHRGGRWNKSGFKLK